MENSIEKPTSAETLQIPQTDCYVEFGHSIGKGKDETWHLTRLLQTVEDKDEVDSETGYHWYERTGKLETVNKSTTNAVVGGGVFVTAAIAEVCKILHVSGKDPHLVIHCGGRPKYLEDNAAGDPEVSEGAVMQSEFNKRLKDTSAPPQKLINFGRTTKDDIINSLDTVLESEGKSVTFVGLGMRFPRFEALYQEVMLETDKYNSIKVHMLPAEDVLRAKALEKNRTGQFEAIWKDFTESEGYKRTTAMEEAGMKRLKESTYGQTPQGTGNT